MGWTGVIVFVVAVLLVAWAVLTYHRLLVLRVEARRRAVALRALRAASASVTTSERGGEQRRDAGPAADRDAEHGRPPPNSGAGAVPVEAADHQRIVRLERRRAAAVERYEAVRRGFPARLLARWAGFPPIAEHDEGRKEDTALP